MNTVLAQNPFNENCKFTFLLDQQCFVTKKSNEVLKPKQKIQIDVSFKSESIDKSCRNVTGKLIVGCEKSYQWIFYLNGIMSKS